MNPGAHWQCTAREPPSDLSRAATSRIWTVFGLSGHQHDIIAQAVNELIDMLPDVRGAWCEDALGDADHTA